MRIFWEGGEERLNGLYRAAIRELMNGNQESLFFKLLGRKQRGNYEISCVSTFFVGIKF